ncbi:MAG: hypothetical protein M1460_04595 [Candidatus Thermoplasmatota archaeon]|nr:hypothetical protein [Candidatus Thermoplasmatota archaeon]
MVYFKTMNLRKNSWKPFLISSVVPTSTDQAANIAVMMKERGFIPEFRPDLSVKMDEHVIEKYLDTFTEGGGYGIFTYRSTSKDAIQNFYRISMGYENLIMDIDMNYAGTLKEDQWDRTIISSHFTNHTEAEGRIGKIMGMKPGALKIACPLNTLQFSHICNFLEGLRLDIPVALIPMGKNRELRVAGAITVSDFAYTYYENSVAEGQYSTLEFSEIIHRIEKEK